LREEVSNLLNRRPPRHRGEKPTAASRAARLLFRLIARHEYA
jgi:hypothetical protein